MKREDEMQADRTTSQRWLVWMLAIAAAMVLLVFVLRKPDRGQPQHPGVGKQLNHFAVGPLLNTEEMLTLGDLRGQVTLINFWGPWCPPCLRELPEMLSLERKYRGRSDARVVLVSASQSGQQPLEELREETLNILLKQKADPPIYEDEANADSIRAIMETTQMNGFGFPTTLLIDGNAKILGIWSGYNPAFVPEMERAIEAATAAPHKK